MSSAIHISFRYLESDYIRAVRAHYASRLRLRVDLAAVITLLAAGIYLWPDASSHWMGVASVSMAILFSLMLLAAFTVIPLLMFRREPKFRDEYSLSLSPEGIHFRTIHIDSQLNWSLYTNALVDPHSYILYYGSRQFTVIPRRVFESVEQQQAFEHLLTERVSDIVRRGK